MFLTSNVFVETGDGYIRKIASDDLTIGTAKKIEDENNEYTPTSIKNEFNNRYVKSEVFTKNETDTKLATKADIASPGFTGIPTCPTPSMPLTQ